ncbi:recombinase family protein [Anaerocolumna sp. AGMB13020]|uniref:recombinase family protein n=1 Tax=Anaerocolumna sp. AGMB13020 TaxID=3081750 RepID=UPI002954CEBE|nr:recombinase family protein [Anaerocolumna sp. AGMB13020]WOO35824.1 recombinase family protein [Anaerocolumna sp. AGMB13020]
MVVVGYARLSRDEDKKNYVSIENQKIVGNQFAAGMNMVIDQWYEDDGFSGYSFNRPGFVDLINNLDNIDVIIAKDLSRLGRHNAKVLLLLDELKEKGKRLLLVTDDYDTFKDEDDVIGIKTWYNERYVKDASKKVRRVIRARQKEGTFLTSVPFGYCIDRSENANNKIVIVEAEAEIVRSIFNLYLEGFGYRKISMQLTDQEIPTPSAMKKKRLQEQGRTVKSIPKEQWSEGMVSDILKNDFYLGHLRQRKRERVLINGTDTRVPKEQQFVFENNHDAIITQHDFELVQETMKKRLRTNYRGKGLNRIFGSSLICKDCGSRLTPITRKNTEKLYYICNTYNQKGKRYCGSSHLITEDTLLQDINIYIKLCRDALQHVIETYDLNDFHKDKNNLEEKRCFLESSIVTKKNELKALLSQKLKDMASGAYEKSIMDETYEELQKEILAKLSGYENQLREIDQSQINTGNVKEKLDTALKVIDNIIDKNSITGKDIEILIDKIIVDKDGNPDIKFKYGLSDLVSYDPAEELNKRENEIILTTMQLILKEERDYTSAKYLSRELTSLGFAKSKKSVLPYIAIMIDRNILKATEDPLKPYKILASKEQLQNMINVYMDTMTDRGHAGNGI